MRSSAVSLAAPAAAAASDVRDGVYTWLSSTWRLMTRTEHITEKMMLIC